MFKRFYADEDEEDDVDEDDSSANDSLNAEKDNNMSSTLPSFRRRLRQSPEKAIWRPAARLANTSQPRWRFTPATVNATNAPVQQSEVSDGKKVREQTSYRSQAHNVLYET